LDAAARVIEKTSKDVEGIVQLASERDLGPVLDMVGGGGGEEEKEEKKKRQGATQLKEET
jgi:hypothetical protein